MCDPEEKETKENLDRRSFVVGAVTGFAAGVLGYLVAAKQLLVGSTGPTPIKGGPYNIQRTDGKYMFVDVSALWNDVGITTEANKRLSNFDQEGTAFAQEALPASFGPDLAIVSCPQDGVKFVFPDETERVMNVIKCQSDRVQIPQGKYSKVHVLGASIRGSTTGLTGFLQFEGGTESSYDLYLEPWRGGSDKADIVLDARKVYLADGTELAGSDVHAYLYHAQISCDSTKVLRRLILPSGCHCSDHEGCACRISDIRVLAITLEP
jgi:hypothetical protein